MLSPGSIQKSNTISLIEPHLLPRIRAPNFCPVMRAATARRIRIEAPPVARG
jgi:hypothetical protein